jgi:HK97 family phage major capsid protein
MVQAADNKILVGRGVRALTSTETKYYEKVIEAMRSNSPQQALMLIDEVLPKTVIDAIFEDITEAHPLLSEINFQNTGALTEIIVSTLDGRHMAAWGKLCDDITEQLLGGFDTIDLTQNKLSAFIPVCKAMLEIGPEWLDRYVRGILAEA